ncbi:MAG: UxaA family hydrolase [Sphingobacteriales bacterium]|nr:UxaA family hydrolase [Sphingobacteriales bacterium]OJY90185.1 MAG: altronate hydrolase [Sphingobacteriales bacterium 44-15]
MSKLMKLNPGDNVYIVRVPLQANDSVEIDGKSYVIKQSLGFGHKIAATSLHPGDKIIKFGIPIGSATEHISAGEHVHLHNMKSDYLPTYTLNNEFVNK